MCGICGVFFYARQGEAAEPASLEAMAERMSHRGPDDAGTFVSRDRRLGFGFRRLSIVDLSPGGHQPMCNEDGTLWLVFNGEIYNHADHRGRLQAKGHVYRGRSDSETILHLYEEHGADCVDHLRGMFAFALWDETKRSLLLARDRMGVKPLYYTDVGGAFVFASEIKALLAFPGVRKELDEAALGHYLSFMVTPAPSTLFAGVRKLRPAHRMVVTENGISSQDCYWDPLPSKSLPRSAGEACDAVRSLLDESVRLRMMSDVPIGALLSGGIDSSSIVALMARHSSGPVNTFTVGYKDSPESNELEFAREVAARYGARHQEVMIDGNDMLDYLPRLVHTQDEPIGDPVCVPLHYVCRLAQQSGVRVLHVGEGSDELFCGYPWYLRYLRESRIWRALGATGLLAPVYAFAEAGLRAAGRGYAVAELLERRRRGEHPFWGGAALFSGAAKDSLLEAPAWNGRRGDSEEVVATLDAQAARLLPELDTLGRMTALELRLRLPELLLMRVDKIAMAVSIEARVPFLDQRLVEYVLPLPEAWKLSKGPKSLLKEAVAGLLPDRIIRRPKQGFPAPVKRWFSAASPTEVGRALLEGPLAARGYFNAAFVRRMLAETASDRRDWSNHLWALYNLSWWYAHWFEGRERPV